MSEKKSAWTVPGPVADDAYKGTAAANPVLVLGADAPAPVRAPYHDGADQRPDGEADRDTRSPAQIEADLGATRARLAGTLDELQERLSPRTLARQAGRGIKGGFVEPGSGRVRRTRAVLAAGAAAGAVAVLAAVRTSRHRS
ncbi:MAG TPA: DUF3618 domain-containing protein [Actinocrinis sp.]|nr:DUF3618 domain-containing protein [Actinocrinis sp.]